MANLIKVATEVAAILTECINADKTPAEQGVHGRLKDITQKHMAELFPLMTGGDLFEKDPKLVNQKSNLETRLEELKAEMDSLRNQLRSIAAGKTPEQVAAEEVLSEMLKVNIAQGQKKVLQTLNVAPLGGVVTREIKPRGRAAAKAKEEAASTPEA